MANLDSILKSRDITLPTKFRLVKAMVFPVVMYGCERWMVKKAEHRRIDAFLKNYKFIYFNWRLITLQYCIGFAIHQHESATGIGDAGSVPGLGRSSGEGNGTPLQYSCLENLMQRSLVHYSPWDHKSIGHN